jgi:IclR helix-turn-helix domain
MPRQKKKMGKPETLSRQRLKLDIAQGVEDAQRKIEQGDWESANKLLQRAGLLARGLVTMPVRARVLKQLPEKDPRYSQSLEYGLKIMALFTDEDPVWGIAEISGAMGMTRSTVHRYAVSLVGLGQLEQTDGRRYRLVEL